MKKIVNMVITMLVFILGLCSVSLAATTYTSTDTKDITQYLGVKNISSTNPLDVTIKIIGYNQMSSTAQYSRQISFTDTIPKGITRTYIRTSGGQTGDLVLAYYDSDGAYGVIALIRPYNGGGSSRNYKSRSFSHSFPAQTSSSSAWTTFSTGSTTVTFKYGDGTTDLWTYGATHSQDYIYRGAIKSTACNATHVAAGFTNGTISITVPDQQQAGSVKLSATSGTTTYGTASKTFTVSSSHGGTLSVAETTSTAATVSISGTTVTIATLGSLAAGTKVTVRVTCAATTSYKAATADYTLTINKATPTLSASPASVSVVVGNSSTTTLTYNGDGTLTVSSAATGTATASISSKTVTIKGVKAGTTTVTVSAAAGTNYSAKTLSISVSVGTSNYSNGSTYFETLADAIAGTSANGTITVFGTDFNDSSNAIVNKNLTINTNAKIVQKINYPITINSGCTLTITGNGRFTAGGDCHIIVNNGTVNIGASGSSYTPTIRRWTADNSYNAIRNAGTLNLYNGTISSKWTTVYNTGTFNMYGGRVEATDEDDNFKNAIYLTDNSKLNISGGTVRVENDITTSTYEAVGITGMGDITITGSPTIEARGYKPLAIEHYSNSASFEATINISGSSTVTATSTGAGYARAVTRTIGGSGYTIKSNLTISGGTFKVTTASEWEGDAIYSKNNTGTTIITGGTIDGSSYGIYLSNTGAVTIGSSSAALSKTNPVVQGGAYGVALDLGSDLNFYNGVIKGTRATPYALDTGNGSTKTIRSGNYEEIIDGPSSGVYSAYLSVTRNYSIGSTYYATLADAIAGASAGNTIKVLKAVTDASTATVNKNLTLDTATFQITKNSSTITVNSGCTLTVTGTGSIRGGLNYLITNNGTLNIGTSGSSTGPVIRNWGATSSNYAVRNNSTLNVYSGTVSARYRAIYTEGTVNVNGGIVQGDGDSEGNFASLYVAAIQTGSGSITNITGGTIKAINNEETYGVRTICGLGNVNVTGGTIIATAGNSAIGIERYGGNTTNIVTFSGGTITSDQYGIVAGAASSATTSSNISITGGTITAGVAGVSSARNTGTVTVTGGTITGASEGILVTYTSTGKLTIGSSSDTLSTSNPSISGGTYGVNAANGFNFYNGVIKGTSATPYSGTATIRTGKYYVKKTGPSSGLYSAYLVLDEIAPVATERGTPGNTNDPNKSVTIWVKVSDADSGINRVEITASTGGAYTSYTTVKRATYNTSAGRYEATFTLNEIVHTVTGATNNGEAAYGFDIYAHDNVGNETYCGYVRWTCDMTAPTDATVKINSDAKYTNTPNVNLTLNASDSLSGMSQMAISNTETIGTFETYATSKNWTLSTGDGEKTVYVIYKDNAGNMTAVFE